MVTESGRCVMGIQAYGKIVKTLCVILTILATMCSTSMAAQTPAQAPTCKVVGVVADKETGEPEPMVTVCVSHKGLPGGGTKKVLADSAGRFEVVLPILPGAYDITAAMIGRVAVPRQITLAEGDTLKNIGRLYMTDDVKMLKQVTVEAQKPLVTMDVDRLTYDVAADPDAKTLRLSEMMGKVPLISVDGDGNIEMNGTKKFLILQNGRKTAITRNPKEVLRSLPAEMVKSIEVITSPGAKYDAEGIGGVINIVMRSQFEGHLTTLSADAGTTAYSGSVMTMSKIGKFAFDGNFSYNRLLTPEENTTLQRDGYGATGATQLRSEDSSKPQGHTEFAMVNASYEIDSLQMITFSLSGMGSQQHTMSDEHTGMWNLGSNEAVYSYLRHGNLKNSSLNGTINLDYQRVGRRNPRRTTTLSYQLSSAPSRNKDITQYSDIVTGGMAGVADQLQLYDSRSDRDDKTNEHTFQYDFSTPLGQQHTLEVGAKYILRNNESQNDLYDSQGQGAEWTHNGLRSNHYKNRNNILGGYLSYTYRGKVVSVMPGLRYEYTYQNIKYLAGPVGSEGNYSSHYANVVPSLKVNLKVGKSQSLRLEYGKRLSRPSIYYLNPYFNNLNPQNIVQGNSSLEAENSYNLGATYGWFTRKTNLTVSLSYRHLSNGIESYSRIIGDGGEYFDDGKHYAAPGAIYTTYLNVGRVERTAVNIYYKWNLTSKLWVTLNTGVAYVDLKDPSRQLQNHGWSANADLRLSWRLPADFSLYAILRGDTKNIALQGSTDGLVYNYFTLSRSFLRSKRLVVSLRAADPFHKWLTRTTYTQGTGYHSQADRTYSRQGFSIGISYRLGDMKHSKTKRSMHSIYNGDLKAAPTAK